MSRPNALVVGFAVTGRAAARLLSSLGYEVVAVDDAPASPEALGAAEAFGVRLVAEPDRGALSELVADAALVVVSPGVPPRHLVFELADPSRIVAEVELAFSVATAPVVAVTGTNGKTTVTSLVTAMLVASGRRAEAVGNIGRPFAEAVSDDSIDCFVVEVSSFQLAWTKQFRPTVCCWLNLAEDHLDWHADLEEYAAAKARIWANQHAGDVAVVNAEDPVVERWAAGAPGRVVTFGLRRGEYRCVDGLLVGPEGPLVEVAELPRALPHDCTNALAAAAVALAAGASLEGVRAALRAGVPMPHRIELVGEADGVRWYDDSKATTPSAVLAALAGFESVVLVVGGRNKGLDLGAIPGGLAEEAATGRGPGLGRLRAVVAIGESAGEVAAAFAAHPEVHLETAGSMREAVTRAGELATAGDAVLLSPGCASFDWYRNYGERGDDFARLVAEHLGGAGGRSAPVASGGAR